MWYLINLKLKSKDFANPEFFIALAILDLLFTPTVKKFRKDFECWRFHWSSTPEDGHRLKLFFKTSSQKAEEIAKFVNGIDFCTFAKREYLETEEIKSEIFGSEESSSTIEVISDESWPEEIQKSWPHYIMGVSDMAIALVEEVKMKQGEEVDQSDKAKIEEYYKKVEAGIASIWKRYGNHAFFHHLALVLGNKEIVVGTTGVSSELRSGNNKISGLVMKIDNQIFRDLS